MLDAIAGKDLDAAIVEHHGNMHDDLAGGRTQYFLHAFVQAEAPGGFVEAGFGRKQRG